MLAPLLAEMLELEFWTPILTGNSLNLNNKLLLDVENGL
jgi:hypothetical protein